jgi:hypothetical protein
MSDVSGRPRGLGLAPMLGWLCAAFFFVASVMTLLLSFDITAPAPTPLPRNRPNLLTGTAAFFANERERWSQEVISGILFAAGFVALVGIAIVLSHRRGEIELAGRLMVASLGIGAALGTAAALSQLGAEQIAIDPHLCDCKYSSLQVIAQGRTLALIQGSGDWLLYGFFALAAVAFAVAAVPAIASEMGRGWRVLSVVIAALFIVGLIASAAGASTLNDLVVGIGGGLLIPVWAVWTGRASTTMARAERAAPGL